MCSEIENIGHHNLDNRDYLGFIYPRYFLPSVKQSSGVHINLHTAPPPLSNCITNEHPIFGY